MVRVFSCHNFTSQQVFSTQSEPIALCCAGNIVFVSTDVCNIEIYTIGEKNCQLTHRFNTIALVQQLLYNEQGNYIATLELKTTRHQPVTFVRVYFNWQTCTTQQPTRARVAGQSVRWSETTANILEVVELPLKESSKHIASCNKTGNLIVAMGTTLNLFYHCSKTLGSSSFVYSDFEQALVINIGFNILEVAVCGDYIASISKSTIRVIKLVWSKQHGPERKRSSYQVFQRDHSTGSVDTYEGDNSFDSNPPIDEDTETPNRSAAVSPWQQVVFNDLYVGEEYEVPPVDDDDYVLWDFSTTLHSKMGDVISPACVLQEASLTDEKDEPVEITGPVETVAGQPITVEWTRKYKTRPLISSTTILYKCCKFPGDATEQYLHSLKLLPTYQKSSRRDRLVGLSCFVSGFHEGFMYDVYNCDCTLLSTYNYTAKSKLVTTTDSLLHAVTHNGVETYTIRKMAAALVQINEPSQNLAIPPATADICLIGFRQFFDITAVSAADNFIILVSKAMDSPSATKNWSIYALEMQDPIALYQDMLQLAARYQVSNSLAYQQLLTEAYLLIKSSVYYEKHQTDSDKLQELIKNCCALLGHHYARDSGKECVLSIPYYKMSGLCLPDIVSNHKQDIKIKESCSRYSGLLHYMDSVLFTPTSDDNINEETSDIILEIYNTYKPTKLSEVILVSNLRQYSDEKALLMLQSNSTHRDEKRTLEKCHSLDCVATSILYLRMCEPEAACSVLMSMTKDAITDVFVQHHHLLLDDNKAGLSHIGQLLRRHRADVLIEILIHLHDNNSIDMDRALDLLDINVGELHHNTHIRNYLEALISANERESIYPKVLELLLRIYLDRLNEQSEDPFAGSPAKTHPHSHVLRGDGHFATRYIWLDELPPFKGSRSLGQQCEHAKSQSFPRASSPLGYSRSTSPHSFTRTSLPQSITHGVTRIANEPCPCCCCNEDLLKLQSLLCWKSVAQETTQKVLSSLVKTMKGFISLELLCQSRLNITAANEIIVENYPHLILDYANSMALWESANHYVALLQMLLAKVNTEGSSMAYNTEDTNSVYMDQFEGVLSVVVELLDPVSLLTLLPSSGSCSFFLPYIERCYKKYKAEQLKEEIIQLVK
ncbi:BLOC-2 complex member HPS3-like [Saccoglossus kowalevskii]|uniref:Hermansky-Pudlak syndrome 3 protein homolog n=1 Tax=Saccoglossus kowalevskii TaxID=10224 RepID=A0ABM0MNM7_SACKO|nr:PREDICTED: Hermansky-Pudlak syndrome 3 protein homolog [Saccoglossus kowalevskii]